MEPETQPSPQANQPLAETSPLQPVPTPPPTPEIPPAPQEEKGFPTSIIILGGILLIILIVGFLLFFLMRTKSAPSPRSEARIPSTPTSISTPILIPPQKFNNEFIRFEYPGGATKTKVNQGYIFGNLRYTTSSLGTSTNLESWITKNEKCGTPETRKGTPYTNPARLQGIRINNLGQCPTAGSSVVDAFYLGLGKTVHAFYLLTDGTSDPTETEKSDFKKLIDSIILNPTTEGSK